MTRLDHNRALAQLALALEVPVASIANVAIWGNHSASQVPDVTHGVLTGTDGIGRPLTEALAENLGGADRVAAWLE